MSKQDLNTQVTEAILKAEALEAKDAHSREARIAFYNLSILEQQLVKQAETTEERNIARRGSIRASLKAGDTERARQLLFLYEDSPDFDAKSNREMRTLVANPNLVYATAR